MYFDISNTADEDGNENRKNVIEDDKSTSIWFRRYTFRARIFGVLLHFCFCHFIAFHIHMIYYNQVFDIGMENGFGYPITITLNI